MLTFTFLTDRLELFLAFDPSTQSEGSYEQLDKIKKIDRQPDIAQQAMNQFHIKKRWRFDSLLLIS